jgi:hypothetical protein
MKRIVLITIALCGVILFFPVMIGDSACLFGHLTGICYYRGSGMHTCDLLLQHYLHSFALLWWSSIALVLLLIFKPNYTNKKQGKL